MQAFLGYDVDLPPQKAFELLLQVYLVKEVGPSAKPDQEVDIALVCRLASAYGPKDSNRPGAVAAGDLQDFGATVSEDLVHAETGGGTKFHPNLGPIPEFGLATRADPNRRLGWPPRVGAAKAMEDGDVDDLHRLPPPRASGPELLSLP
jgi:hypothetical protein